MIFDSLSRLQHYASIIPLSKQISRVIASTDWNRTLGKITLEAQGAYANVDRYLTEPRSMRFFECHQIFIDVQIVIAGEERLGFCEKGICRHHPYDAQKDFQKLDYDGPISTVILRPGYFAALFPYDAHMPKLMVEETPSEVLKVVVKLPVLNH